MCDCEKNKNSVLRSQCGIGRGGCEPQRYCLFAFIPFSPHDAIKHHYASLKNDLIPYT